MGELLFLSISHCEGFSRSNRFLIDLFINETKFLNLIFYINCFAISRNDDFYKVKNINKL